MKVKHGMYGTPTYRSWWSMISRCRCKNHSNFKRYGGNGVGVCERWLKFENFFSDMGERPDGKTIDRINNNGNYELGNCRWATRKEQDLNKANSRWFFFHRMYRHVSEISDMTGVPRETILLRVDHRRMTIYEAVSFSDRSRCNGFAAYI